MWVLARVPEYGMRDAFLYKTEIWTTVDSGDLGKNSLSPGPSSEIFLFAQDGQTPEAPYQHTLRAGIFNWIKMSEILKLNTIHIWLTYLTTKWLR